MNLPLHSENINEISAALAKAQGEIKGAEKDSKNPFHKNTYASLHSHREATREPLSRNGLSFTQMVTILENGQNVLVTMLSHVSGQWFKSYMPLTPKKNDEQGYGSAITYMRRYALSAMLGTTPDEDDDGNAAVKAENATPKKDEPKCITQDQVIHLHNMINGDKTIREALFKRLEKNNVTNLEKIPDSKYAACCEYVENLIKARDNAASQPAA